MGNQTRFRLEPEDLDQLIAAVKAASEFTEETMAMLKATAAKIDNGAFKSKEGEEFSAALRDQAVKLVMRLKSKVDEFHRDLVKVAEKFPGDDRDMSIKFTDNR